MPSKDNGRKDVTNRANEETEFFPWACRTNLRGRLAVAEEIGFVLRTYRSAQVKEVSVSSKSVSTPRVYTRTPIGLIQKLRSLGHG